MATVDVAYPSTVGANYKTGAVLIGELKETFDAGTDDAILTLYSKTKSDSVGDAYTSISANGFTPAAAWFKAHSDNGDTQEVEMAINKSGTFHYLRYNWSGLTLNGVGPSIQEFTNDYLMGSGSPSSEKLVTQAAIKNWVDRQSARGYATATTTTITTTGVWTDINSMSVSADFSGVAGGDTAYVHFHVHGYATGVSTVTDWKVRVLANGVTSSSITPEFFLSSTISNIGTVSGVARFTGLNAANHTFKLQAYLFNAATLTIGDAASRAASMLVTGG